jgi:hypothetical protein
VVGLPGEKTGMEWLKIQQDEVGKWSEIEEKRAEPPKVELDR